MSGRGTPDLQRLLPLARAGDGAAWGELLEQYRAYLALLARRGRGAGHGRRGGRRREAPP